MPPYQRLVCQSAPLQLHPTAIGCDLRTHTNLRFTVHDTNHSSYFNGTHKKKKKYITALQWCQQLNRDNILHKPINLLCPFRQSLDGSLKEHVIIVLPTFFCYYFCQCHNNELRRAQKGGGRDFESSFWSHATMAPVSRMTVSALVLHCNSH